jgi:hypothetical protein
MIEPYLIDIAIEVLKALGGILVPVITTVAILYKRKLDLKFQAAERKFQRSEVQREIDRYAQWAGELQSFKLLGIEEKKQTIKDAIERYVLDNNISITESELNLMIERALLLPKTFRKLLLSRLEEHDGLEIDFTE